MKIQFAGVGSAFTDQRYYQSNMVVTAKSGKRLMIDCGTDARFSFGELGATNLNIGDWVDGVYLSHCHADHIGGLEWIAFCTYFNPAAPKPKLYIADVLVTPLWETLRAGLQSIEATEAQLEHFFDVRPITIGAGTKYFCWEGITFNLVKTEHVVNGSKLVPSYGLYFHDVEEDLWERKNPAVFLTTDTMISHYFEWYYKNASLIFHDCETAPYHSGVHASYDHLKKLPEHVRSKTWLYHYQPDPPQDPVEDGFLGFVKKGQVFEV